MGLPLITYLLVHSASYIKRIPVLQGYSSWKGAAMIRPVWHKCMDILESGRLYEMESNLDRSKAISRG